MQFRMDLWAKDQIDRPLKKALPVLSFPGIQKIGISVSALIESAYYQAECMKIIADDFDTAAVFGFMDLSVEAEAFGSTIVKTEGEVPTVVGSIIDEDTDLSAIRIPEIGEGRTGNCIKSIEVASNFIADRPVFAGTIGPFSLAGRLMDVNEIMPACLEEPEFVHDVLDITSKYLIDYILAYKEAGANGVLVAEPMSGLLSPELVKEFVVPYCQKMVEATQDEHFMFMLHNCGDSVNVTAKEMADTGAAGFNFGNSARLDEIIPQMPTDRIVSGNLDPSSQFRYGNPFGIHNATIEMLDKYSVFPNFIPSSGCDIPPLSPWGNIQAFFEGCKFFYHGKFLKEMVDRFGLEPGEGHKDNPLR